MNKLEALLAEQMEKEKTLANINNEFARLAKNKKQIEERLKEVKQKINALEAGLQITDHAVVRYFERVLGFDINLIRKEILPANAKDQIIELGNCDYPSNNCILIVRNCTIVTVVEKNRDRKPLFKKRDKKQF